jgi:hypothetical protein
VRWDPLLDGTVLAEGREVNTMAYRYRTRRAALRGVVVAPCLRTGRYGAKSIKGERFTIRDRREPKLSRGSLPTHEVLPRADPRSLAFAPEALLGPYSAALGSPQRSWGLVSAPPDTYRGVLWPAGGSSPLHSAVLARIRIPLRWSKEKI